MQNEKSVSFGNTSDAFASRSDKELRKMHLLFSLMKREILTKIGSFFLKSAVKLHLPVNFFIVRDLYNQFCGGESLEEVSRGLKRLRKLNIQTILDYGVEAGSSEDSYNYAFRKIIETINFAASQPGKVYADFKVSAIAHTSILEKLQNGKELSDEEYRHLQEVRRKMDLIAHTCSDNNVQIMVDAEESWIQGAIDALVYDLMIRYNKEIPVVYNTIQMYRRDGLLLLEKAFSLAEREGFILGVKLVRGAYMEKEAERASRMAYPNPIFNEKSETDDAFDQGLEFCAVNHTRIAICCGTHNEKSSYHLIDLMNQLHINKDHPHFLFAQLLGMSDNITYNLAAAGYNVAKYIPYGPFKDVIPYLIRRANENKSIAGQTGRELQLIEQEMKRRGISK